MNVDIRYKKLPNATAVQIEIVATDGQLGLLDVIRALTSIMNTILTTGKY